MTSRYCQTPSHPQNGVSNCHNFGPPSPLRRDVVFERPLIRSLKAKYRTNVVRKIIRSLEKNKTLPKISLLHGMEMLVCAWNALTTETIVNCFHKAGISAEKQDAAIAEDDDPFKDLRR